MIQGSVLANEFHVCFAIARKSVQKAHTTFQPLRKSDVRETSCELLHRGILTPGLDGGGCYLQRSPGSPLPAKVSAKLVGPIKLELAG